MIWALGAATIPRVVITAGAALDDAEIEAMWALRDSLVSLKPDRDRARAQAEFRATIRASRSVGRVFDPDDRLIAMLTLRTADIRHAGRPIHLLCGGYGFVARDRRSSPLVVLMYAATFVRAASLRPGRAQYFTAVAYPVSALRMASFEPLIVLGQPGLSAREQFVLETVRDHLVGSAWDASRGAVSMETIPEPLTPAWIDRHGRHPVYMRYVAQLPDWDRGYALPVAMPISLYRLHRVLGPMARRSWHRALRRQNLHEP